MKQSSSFADGLREATRAAPLTDAQVTLMEEHWRLVLAWNQRVNLTAITDDVEAAWVHYADSLAGRAQLVAGSIVDLGSGAGYPGIPLAIAEPDRTVLLVEPRQKRTSFLDVVASRLGLKNVRTRVGRSEEEPGELFANVVTRATFSEEGDLEACLRWVAPGGRLIAYRADNVRSKAIAVVPYRLRRDTHALHIWQT